MFPMKTGLALFNTAPYAKEVYPFLYPATKLPHMPNRSRQLGRFFHVYYHSIPQASGWCAGALLVSMWWTCYTLENKTISVAGAFAYTLAESAFTTVERGQAYTSAGQFFANVVYIPIMLRGYPTALQALTGVPAASALFVFLYPLNIWFLEVVQDLFILKPIFGRNVAWNYSDYADEALTGTIRAGHAPAWWALGAGVWLGFPAAERLVRELWRKT